MSARPTAHAVTSWLLICGSLIGCADEKPAVEPVFRPVRVQAVYATGGTRQRTFSGVAEAGIESSLSFKVSGSIQRVAVEVGDSVRPGELIAELDPTDYELQLEQADASLAQAEAEARRASADYERTRGLYENRNASKNDLDAARSADESARARVEAARKSSALARQKLSYCKLTAPAPGAIADVPVDVNENVQQGQKIAVLTSGDRKKVAVGVPEILISQVREGQDVTVRFDALSDRTYAARVSEVGVSASGSLSMFPVAVLLNDAAPDVRPGMAAEVVFTFRSASPRERFVVPPVAVGEDRQGRFLFVAVPSGVDSARVERRVVSVGELTGEGLEVLEGLFEGDLLITAGVSKLSDGQIVKLSAPEADAT